MTFELGVLIYSDME